MPPFALLQVHIPVHKNRSVESTATLYAGNNTVLLQFKVRLHGYDAVRCCARAPLLELGPAPRLCCAC